MAERTYVITIKNETSQQVAKEVGGAGGINQEKEQQSQESPIQEKALGMLKRMVGVGAILGYANQEIAYQISKVEVRTGDKEAQQRASYIYSKASPLANTFISSLAVSGGNVAVAGITTAISALTTALTTGIQVLREIDTARLNQTLQDTQQGFRTERATYSGSRYQNVSRE